MKKPINLKLTKDGFQKLVDEERELKEQRPGVLKRMVEAREQGDLSENAGYHAAKERLGYIDSRLRHLKLMIRFAEVVESSGDSSVSFGNTVVVENQGEKMTYTVVSAQEANPIKGKVSDVSPFGKALLGKKIGDLAIVETPESKISLKVLEIKI